MLESALFGALAGIIGGILAYVALNMALLLEWQAVKGALRRQYQRERKERPLDIGVAAPPAPMTTDQIRAYVLGRNPHLTRNG